MIPIVPDVDLVAGVPGQYLLPLLPAHEGRGVHGAAVADDEAVALARFREGEEGVFDLDHGAQEVLLRAIKKIQQKTKIKFFQNWVKNWIHEYDNGTKKEWL